jgi:peptidyl-prolyl cis-trans isomerase A (cyclophilin A)
MTDAPTEFVAVAIETSRGAIEVVLNLRAAPITTTNFLDYVDRGLYDAGHFHRTVTGTNQPNDSVLIEVIQGGFGPDRQGEAGAPIPLERTSDTGIRHVDGAISMARRTPDSAVSDFFICIGEQPELDFGGHRNPDGQGFAAFGQVTAGMDIVRAIQTSPHEGQRLTPPVPIRRIRRRT